MNHAPVYDSADRPPRSIEELNDVLKYRHLIFEFVRRDVVTRYKRSVLGIAWTMLNPLGTMLIMVLVFAKLFTGAGTGYPVYVLAGLVFWNFFSQVTQAAPQTLLWSGPLIHRVYMPRTVFAFTAVGAALVNLLLSFVPLVAVMLLLRVPFGWPLLTIPFAVLLLAMFALGLGLALSSAVAYFPDVLDIYQIVLVAWMYLSAIFYPYDLIPESYRWWFFNLNPIYHLLVLFRDPIYGNVWPSLMHVGAAVIIAFGTLIFGWMVFTKREDELAYRL